MNTDTLQLIGQIVLIGLGPLLARRGITIGSAQVDEVVGAIAFVAGVVWKFVHWNATPAAAPVTIKPGTIPPAGTVLICLVLAGGILGFSGCAALQPGADPLVVRVEQTETVAKSTFDSVLGIDNAQRSFFDTNAPAFASFCEWLRAPQPITGNDAAALGTNSLPRASAMLLSLDDVKIAYESASASSNDLYTALQTVTAAMGQANAWLSVTTNSAP